MAVAAKILLQSLKNLLEVIFTGDTLNGGDGLAAVTLLMSDVNVVGRSSFFVTSLGERIYQLIVSLKQIKSNTQRSALLSNRVESKKKNKRRASKNTRKFKIYLPKDLRFSMDVDIKGEVFRSIKLIKYKLKVIVEKKEKEREGGRGKKLIYKKTTKKKKVVT